MKQSDTDKLLLYISQIRKSGNDHIEKELKRHGIEGILPSHGSIFAALEKEKGGLGVSELAEKVKRSKSTLSVMVRGLVKKGYLSINESPENSSKKSIVLTKKYKALEDTIHDIGKSLIEKAYGTMSLAKQEQLVSLLQELEYNLSRDES